MKLTYTNIILLFVYLFDSFLQCTLIQDHYPVTAQCMGPKTLNLCLQNHMHLMFISTSFFPPVSTCILRNQDIGHHLQPGFESREKPCQVLDASSIPSHKPTVYALKLEPIS